MGFDLFELSQLKFVYLVIVLQTENNDKKNLLPFSPFVNSNGSCKGARSESHHLSFTG